MSKGAFFKKVKNLYRHWRGEIYKLIDRKKGIENAEYLQWDYTHNDLEAYNSDGQHIGSINPHTNKIYKPAVYDRRLF